MTTAIEGHAVCTQCGRSTLVEWPNDDPTPYVPRCHNSKPHYRCDVREDGSLQCPHCGGELQDPERWEPMD